MSIVLNPISEALVSDVHKLKLITEVLGDLDARVSLAIARICRADRLKGRDVHSLEEAVELALATELEVDARKKLCTLPPLINGLGRRHSTIDERLNAGAQS